MTFLKDKMVQGNRLTIPVSRKKSILNHLKNLNDLELTCDIAIIFSSSSELYVDYFIQIVNLSETVTYCVSNVEPASQ